MKDPKLIILGEFKFFKDIFHRIIANIPELNIVADESNPKKYKQTLQDTDTDWVVWIREHRNEVIPEEVNDCIQQDISKRLMIFEATGGQVDVKWFEPHERELSQKNLGEIMQILVENNPSAI